MANNHLKFSVGPKQFDLQLTQRDAGILMGPQWLMKEGHAFVQAIGVYDHFTVANGIPGDSQSVRPRIAMKLATEALIVKLKTDEDLLAWDYSYSDPNDAQSDSGGSAVGFRCFSYSARVNVQPAGFCTLTLMETSPAGRGRNVGLPDVRNKPALALDTGGELRIRRRKADFALLPVLESLREFLDDRESKEVVIHHRV